MECGGSSVDCDTKRAGGLGLKFGGECDGRHGVESGGECDGGE